MQSSQFVEFWWMGLSGIALLNFCLLIWSRYIFNKKKDTMSAELLKFRNWQFYLSAIYVIGCGFRSVLPREDLVKIVMVDHWISAVAIGRSVATIAELSFIVQLSLLLYEAGKFTGNKTMQTLAKIPFPLILIAECFSWYACVTTNNLGSVFEESLWGISAAIIMAGMLMADKYYNKIQKQFVRLCSAGLLAYVIYMFTVDVPNYFRNWQVAQAIGKKYSSLHDGFIEVAIQWTYSREYADWEYAFIWMTLYFSIAVWVSIYLMNAPALDKNLIRKEG